MGRSGNMAHILRLSFACEIGKAFQYKQIPM